MSWINGEYEPIWFLCSLFGDGLNQTGTSSKLLHAQKIEPITVSELNQYVLTADPQVSKILVDWVSLPDVSLCF